MRIVQRMAQFVGMVLPLVACSALLAQNPSAQKSSQKGDHRIRNIVLVHGAWADASGWKGVYDILVKDGVVYISHPKEVAALIEEAATHVP